MSAYYLGNEDLFNEGATCHDFIQHALPVLDLRDLQKIRC